MICAWVFALAACTAAPDADIDAFFKEFAAKREGIVALDASFTQKNKLPEEELTSKGSLIFVKPRRIIFHTDDPDRTTLVDDRSGYEYDPEIKQLQIFDIEDNPQADIFFLGFNSSTDRLRKAYDLSLFEITDDPRGKHGLTIKPRAQSKEQAYFLEVNLYLRDEDFLPYRIHIRNDQESEVFIEVESINKSFRPTPQLTQIFLPQDTKVVENDRVVETVAAGGKRVPDAILLPPEPGMLQSGEEKAEIPKGSVALPPPPLVPAGTAVPAPEPAPAPEAQPAPAPAPEPAAAPAPETKPEAVPETKPVPASGAKSKVAPASKAKPKAEAKPKSSVKKSTSGTAKNSTAGTTKKSAADAATKSTAGAAKKSATKAPAAKKAETKKAETKAPAAKKAAAKPADGDKAKGAQ